MKDFADSPPGGSEDASGPSLQADEANSRKMKGGCGPHCGLK